MSDEQRKQKSFSNEHNKPHVTKHVRFDGRVVTLATLETQTDWNWLERTKLRGIFKVYITDVDADLNHSLPELKDSTGTPRPGFKTSKSDEEDSIAEEAGSSEIETPVKVLSKCDTKDKNKDSKKFNRPLVDSARSDCTLDISGQFSGVFIGICEFCGQVIKPFPSLEDQILMDALEFAFQWLSFESKDNKSVVHLNYENGVLMSPETLFQLTCPWYTNARSPYDAVLAVAVVSMFGSNDDLSGLAGVYTFRRHYC